MASIKILMRRKVIALLFSINNYHVESKSDKFFRENWCMVEGQVETSLKSFFLIKNESLDQFSIKYKARIYLTTDRRQDFQLLYSLSTKTVLYFGVTAK